jgi:hypothetical protein
LFNCQQAVAGAKVGVFYRSGERFTRLIDVDCVPDFIDAYRRTQRPCAASDRDNNRDLKNPRQGSAVEEEASGETTVRRLA